jgi:hypothetical protein
MLPTAGFFFFGEKLQKMPPFAPLQRRCHEGSRTENKPHFFQSVKAVWDGKKGTLKPETGPIVTFRCDATANFCSTRNS